MYKKGVIIKSQKELYHVKTENFEYLCKARGVFREKKIKPIVGDKVLVQILDNNTAYIEEIFNRKNFLIRPPIANVDQILLVHTLQEPLINYLTFDKYLVMLEHYKIPVKIIINKIELTNDAQKQEFEEIYSKTNYDYLYTSTRTGIGIDNLEKLLINKISSFAGPSGVGKSTLLNRISDDFEVQTADISKKTSRGRHTTRHVELFEIFENSYLFDTPGFSALNLSFIDDFKYVKNYFNEFKKYSLECKFKDCEHINEPKCGVKEAVENGKISKSRYNNYIFIREEIKKERKY